MSLVVLACETREAKCMHALCAPGAVNMQVFVWWRLLYAMHINTHSFMTD